MLLTESEKAKQVRSLMLDIVIDTINKKIGAIVVSSTVITRFNFAKV